MKLTTILFDLDGTLLPMDEDTFLGAYFLALSKKLGQNGYDTAPLYGQIMAGTSAMLKNDGSDTNENAFWAAFSAACGRDCRLDEAVFLEFYEKDFPSVQAVCGFDPTAAETISALKEMGLRLVLATNPVFPAAAVYERLRWAGIPADSFELITSFENSRFCKPRLGYYEDILKAVGVQPEECMMVGNNTDDDMPAGELGMRLFLVTDCLINKSGQDTGKYENGSLSDLLRHIRSITA